MISTAFIFYTPAHRCYCLQQITSKANHRRFHNQCCELKCAWTPGAECSRSPWNPQSCLLFPGSWRCLLLAACCLLPAGRVYVLEWFPRCWAAGREDDLWTCQTIKRICGRWHHRQSTQEQLACFNNLSFTIWPLNLRSMPIIELNTTEAEQQFSTDWYLSLYNHQHDTCKSRCTSKARWEFSTAAPNRYTLDASDAACVLQLLSEIQKHLCNYIPDLL